MTDLKKSQLNPKVKKLFTETEVGALLEDIDQKMGSVAEGQTMLVGITNKLVGRMDRLEDKVDVLVDTVGEMKVEMTEMKVEMTEMKVEMTEMNGKLDHKADRIDLERLGHRVTILETK